MENEIISVNHDMFKEETTKRFNCGWNGEIMDYISVVGDYLPQYADSEYTFETSFNKDCCMDKYDVSFDVFSKSNTSKDQIFIQLDYSQVESLSPEMDKIEKDEFILRINDTNITLQRSSIDRQIDNRGGWDITILYEVSKETLKQIADAKQLYIRVPLMKDLQNVKNEIFADPFMDKTDKDRQEDKESWKEIQENYANECKSFQNMCRLFYAAAIDEVAYPGLIEKEMEILTETKKAADYVVKERNIRWERREEQAKIGNSMEIVAAAGYPTALVVGGIWSLVVASWTPIITLFVLVSAILIILAIVRNA